MAKKVLVSKFDFDFGTGVIIPSTQEAYKQESMGFSLKPERSQLADFKSAFGKEITTRLDGNSRFPSSHEFFIFIVQYFIGVSDYHCRDIDNMAKTILDVLKGRFYQDDGQVKTLLVTKKIDLRRVPQSFAFVAVKEIKNDGDVEALKVSGIERSVTLYQELKSQRLV